MEYFFNCLFAIIFPFGQDGWKVLSLVSIIFAIKYFNVWKKDKIILSLLVFLFYGLILSVFSKDVVSGFEEMQRYFFGWLFPFLLGYAVVDETQKRKLLNLYLIVFSFTVFLGFLAYFNIIPDRISYLTFIVDERLGVICGHTIFGGKCAFIILILTTLFLFEKNNKYKYIFAFGAVFYFFALLLSGTRAYYISVFCTFILMILFYIIKNKKAVKILTLFVLLSILAVAVYKFNPVMHERINKTSITKDTSLVHRIDMYKHGLNLLLKEHRIFGFYPAMSATQDGNIHKLPHFHNIYLQIILDFGFVGFALFLIILYVMFKRLFCLYKNTGNCQYLMLIFAWIAVLISENFDSLLRYPFFTGQCFWITGLMLGGVKNDK